MRFRPFPTLAQKVHGCKRLSTGKTGGRDRFCPSSGEPRPYHQGDHLAGTLAAQIGIHLCKSSTDDLRDVRQQLRMPRKEAPHIVARDLEHDRV